MFAAKLISVAFVFPERTEHAIGRVFFNVPFFASLWRAGGPAKGAGPYG